MEQSVFFFLPFCTLHDIINLQSVNRDCNSQITSQFKELHLLKLSDLFQVTAIKTGDVPFKQSEDDKYSLKSKRYTNNNNGKEEEEEPDTIPKYTIKATEFKGISILNNKTVKKFELDFDDSFIAEKSISDHYFEIEINKIKSISLSSKLSFKNVKKIEEFIIYDGNEWDLTFWDPPCFRGFKRNILTLLQCPIHKIHVAKTFNANFWSKENFNRFDVNTLTSLSIDYLHTNHWTLELLSTFKNLEEIVVNDYATDKDKGYVWTQFDPEGWLTYINFYFAQSRCNRNNAVKILKEKIYSLKKLKKIIWKGKILNNHDELCNELMIIVDGVNNNQAFRNKYDSD